MNLILALFLVIFESVPEALADRGKKAIAGNLEFVYRTVVTVLVFAWANQNVIGSNAYAELSLFEFLLNFILNYWTVLVGYVLLRFALFDPLRNVCAGMPLFYIGSTKLYDKIWQSFFKWTKFPPEHFFAMFKFIALLIGITLLVK